MMIRLLAPDPASAQQLAMRLYPTATIGTPVAVSRATSAAASQFHIWLKRITQRKHHENISLR